MYKSLDSLVRHRSDCVYDLTFDLIKDSVRITNKGLSPQDFLNAFNIKPEYNIIVRDPTEKVRYHTATTTWYGRIRDIFADALPQISGGIILDIGCSNGSTTEELADLYPQTKVIGIDINASALSTGRQTNSNSRKAEYLMMNGYKLGFKKQSFDVVFCNNNLFYAMSSLESERASDIFKEINDLIKDNGYLIVSAGDKSSRNYVIFKKSDEFFELEKVHSDYEKHSLEKVIMAVNPKAPMLVFTTSKNIEETLA